MPDDLEYVPLQSWTCITCGRGGQFESSEDCPYLRTILQAATAHAEKSPECAYRNGVAGLWVKLVLPKLREQEVAHG